MKSHYLLVCNPPLKTHIIGQLRNQLQTLQIFTYFAIFLSKYSKLLLFLEIVSGNFLVVQWLGLHASTAGGHGFDPWSGN